TTCSRRGHFLGALRVGYVSVHVTAIIVICAIVGCENQSKRDKEKSFYRLASIISHQGAQTVSLSRRRQEAWLAKIKRKSFLPKQYYNIRVCSDHFINGSPSKL
uniref:THAP-type domain-containing protein n=1 Tax=Amphimedon queenslandica TaxID=400682 RepID=A0A1X7TUF0_AMPQE